MPADLLKFPDGRMRIDLDRCYTPFVEKACRVLAACRARGQDYYPYFGYRSIGLQATLRQAYLEGRGGKAAPAGLSAHNYGFAWDVGADGDTKPGFQPIWDPKRFQILGEETEREGLVWGGRFGDSPHIQWPGFVSGEQLKPLRQIWCNCPAGATEGQRLSTIWAYLDALAGK